MQLDIVFALNGIAELGRNGLIVIIIAVSDFPVFLEFKNFRDIGHDGELRAVLIEKIHHAPCWLHH
jgi:hypothetical protein